MMRSASYEEDDDKVEEPCELGRTQLIDLSSVVFSRSPFTISTEAAAAGSSSFSEPTPIQSQLQQRHHTTINPWLPVDKYQVEAHLAVEQERGDKQLLHSSIGARAAASSEFGFPSASNSLELEFSQKYCVTVWPPRSYSCTFCRRDFNSAQALGGHMNVHRRDRARLRQSAGICNVNPPNSNTSQYFCSAAASNSPLELYSGSSAVHSLAPALATTNSMASGSSNHNMYIMNPSPNYTTVATNLTLVRSEGEFGFSSCIVNDGSAQLTPSISHSADPEYSDLRRSTSGVLDLELRLGRSSVLKDDNNAKK